LLEPPWAAPAATVPEMTPVAASISRPGGKPVAEAYTQIAGQKIAQTAFVWDPIEQLLAASPQAAWIASTSHCRSRRRIGPFLVSFAVFGSGFAGRGSLR